MSETRGNNASAGINVLLVDDSPFARGIGRRVLQYAGIISVREAASGQEAIDILTESGNNVHIVFCDLMMPDMDGIQMVRRVATLASPPWFVFLSGSNAAMLSAAEETARARGLRVLRGIQKPLTPNAVYQALARLSDELAPSAGSSILEITPEDLDEALAKEQFVLHFQPKVSAIDGGLVGFEALVRWQRPGIGLIPPAAFIGVAERSGRIGALTDQTTVLALKQSTAWSKSGLYATMSLNLSPYMLIDLDLPDRLADEAKRFGVEPSQLILEITESGLFQDNANTLDILARLHMKGFPLSIDDFGSGYSSMEHLLRVPFAELKIDRAFVDGASSNAKTKAILDSSASLGRSLAMSVVAEGVETEEDWKAVRAADVDIVQGYFIGRPMAAELVPAWVAQNASIVR